MATVRTHSEIPSSTGNSDEALGWAELILEIGTEELPYQFVAPALGALHEAAEHLLTEQRLSFDAVRTMGTPRRLVVLVGQLGRHQAGSVKETMGPSKAIAFDASGRPTKAAIGFAAGQGIAVEHLEIRSTPKGEYVFAVKQESGQATAAVLAHELPKLIGRLSFPKTMHWNRTGVRFARPIRWLVALCHGQVLPLEYAGVTAGAISYGHRFNSTNGEATAQNCFRVENIEQYLTAAEHHGVIVDQERRRRMIEEQLATLAKSAGGMLHHDDELVEQAVYAVEYPQTILGSFQPSYLSLPKEVLMTSMKEHQGFFALTDEDGTLLPHFMAVTNMKLPDMQLIREGNERVLAARLADAKFFYDEDRKVKLADRLEGLRSVTFHQKLGSVFQRAMRIKALAGSLGEQVSDGALAPTVQRAAELCKTDLVTGIVGEFPTLQGIMGGIYATHDGEEPAVAQAIAEQYLPRGMDGDIPRTVAGQVLSLAERLDKIAGFFRVGIIPKGSEDPYALRRDALAIVRIMVESRLAINIASVLGKANEVLQHSGIATTVSTTQQDQLGFIVERLRFYAGTVGKLRRDDVIGAVLTSINILHYSFAALVDRMKALEAVTTRQDFDPLIVGFKRAHRLCEKEQWDRQPVDPALFDDQAEADLYQARLRAQQQFAAAMEQKDDARALDVLVSMKEPIDAFFAGVMVNADESSLRSNRLSLLKDVDDLFMSFADLSQIVIQGS